MFSGLEAPLEGYRLWIARIVLSVWGAFFAISVVAFGVTFILYCSPGMPLGPCAPMPVFLSLVALVGTGVPWVPLYLMYRQARRPGGLGATPPVQWIARKESP